MNKKIFFLVFLPALFYGHLLMARDYRPQELPVFLDTLQRHFRTLGWDDLDPGKIPWESHRVSHLGNPLFFTTFGEAQKNTTVFLAGVHGNESPSVYMTLRLAQHLTQNPQVYKNSFIVIAPLVNPDGFFAKPPKRTNARGVDINRNFPTQDWRKGKQDQYFPGSRASSENETKFQIALFQRFKPEKIVSIHAPFGCYDYDGPSSDLDDFVQWLKKSSRENNFPLRRYRVFPGSLGNYAGVERKISTLTLELPSSIPQNGPAYFDQFRNTLIEILHQYPNGKH